VNFTAFEMRFLSKSEGGQRGKTLGRDENELTS